MSDLKSWTWVLIEDNCACGRHMQLCKGQFLGGFSGVCAMGCHLQGLREKGSDEVYDLDQTVSSKKGGTVLQENGEGCEDQLPVH